MAAPVQVFPPSMLRMSTAGVNFLYLLERQIGISNHLHWPGGSSGVTVGAGYDFLNRSTAIIQNDLISVGVPKINTAQVSAGSGLSGTNARTFAAKNQNAVNLSESQQLALLRKIISSYEAVVRRNVFVPISQAQFDALVSLSYNPGTSIVPIAKAINSAKFSVATQDWLSRTRSNGVTMPGLITRRKKEVNLFLTGRYA